MTDFADDMVGPNNKYPVGSEEWGARVRRRAQKLNTILETGYMELAEILYTIYDTPIDNNPQNAPIFKSWGYDSWEEWVDREIQIKPEKARYLRRVHYVLNVELAGMPPVTRGRITKLGFSKVGKLLRVLTLANAERWCDMAETLTNKELENAVKDSLKEAEKRFIDQAVNGDETMVEPEPVRPLDVKNKSFPLWPEQLHTVGEALQRAQELSNSKKQAHNLTLICMDFLANNDFRLANDVDMQARYIAKLEALLGKKLVLVDPDTKEVEYGLEALQLILQEGAPQ